MYVYIDITYIYICMYVCICIDIYIYSYVRIYIYVCMCVCMYACMHACMHGWMDGWMDGWMMDGCMHVGMCGCADDLFVRTRPYIYGAVGYPSVDPSLYPYNISCFYACIYRWH